MLPNVWLGTSVESADYLGRIDDLRKVDAAVRFVSFEPLLGSVARADLTGIQWAIVGGESGPRSRPMAEQWVAEIEAACRKARTAFFFKQWGGKNKKAGGSARIGATTYDELPILKHADSVIRVARPSALGVRNSKCTVIRSNAEALGRGASQRIKYLRKDRFQPRLRISLKPFDVRRASLLLPRQRNMSAPDPSEESSALPCIGPEMASDCSPFAVVRCRCCGASPACKAGK